LTLRKPDPTGVVIGPLRAILLRRIESRTRSGSGVPLARDRRLAGLLDLPLELDAGGIEHAARRLRQLRPDAVAGDERDSVGHVRILVAAAAPEPDGR